MEFKKALAIYYHGWHKDSLESVKYCRERGDEERALQYEHSAKQYAEIIENNKEAIEFFSQGRNAFMADTFLPKEFRGYK